jgi:hypothetical protein
MRRTLRFFALLMVLALVPTLAVGTPESGESWVNDHCPETCAQMKESCRLDCLPCGYVAACYHYVCDVFCGCNC